jgi:hypothetical protein
VLALKQCDRPRVLFTPKHQLGFFFALSSLFPDRHRDAHHDGHHAQADEQDHHRIAAFAIRVAVLPQTRAANPHTKSCKHH